MKTVTYYRNKENKDKCVKVARCFNMAYVYEIDLQEAMLEKHRFNQARPYLHGKTF